VLFVLVIEYWNLVFVCNLLLGIWDLEMFDDFYEFPLTAYYLPLTTDYYILLLEIFDFRD